MIRLTTNAKAFIDFWREYDSLNYKCLNFNRFLKGI